MASYGNNSYGGNGGSYGANSGSYGGNGGSYGGNGASYGQQRPGMNSQNSHGSSGSSGGGYASQRPGQYGQSQSYGGNSQQQYGGHSQQQYGGNSQQQYGGRQQQYGQQYGQQQYGHQQYGQQQYGQYGQYGDQQAPVPGQETEQDVDRVQQQIRDTRQESVESTRNALRALQGADESAGRTMQQLGEQSEQLARVEISLDSAQVHADNAQSKAGELKTVNRSMFAIHVKNPFNSSKKKERELEEAKRKAAEVMAQREAVRKEEYESKQRVNMATGQGVYGRSNGGYGNNYSNNGRGGPGERSAYNFENNAEDNAAEDEIDHNLDLMGGILNNLKKSAVTMNTEVNRQNERMTGIIGKTDNLHGSVTHNTNLLQKISKKG